MALTFDGANKLIICSSGTITLNALDIYSRWKEWVTTEDNSKYLLALSAIGGDPLYGAVSLGSTFFLENGWKIRPQEANHTLTVNGNIYVREGGNPFVSTLGSFNVLIVMARSNLVDTVSTSGSTGPTPEEVAEAVWNADSSSFSISGTKFGNLIRFSSAVEGGKWEIVGNQMIFYDKDNTTEVARFNLFNENIPSADNVTKRERVN